MDDRKVARLLAEGLQEERFVVDIAHTGEAGDEMASVKAEATGDLADPTQSIRVHEMPPA